MSEHQAARPVDLSLSSAAKKPDAQLRLVSMDGKVRFPENGQPTDQAATIISKNKPRAAPTSVTTGEMLAGKSLRGQRLAHFELLEPLGVGGMAAVILARDTQLDRLVALKILPPEMASDLENVRRFHQEARAAAKLNHENIARVFYCGEDKDLHFIAFEYVEGDNLRTLLERRGPLPVAEAVRYVLQIATGLEHAASRGVVHRDIKPSNIIINPNGQAKLVDMGLARNTETHSDQALTQSGVTLGTFDYISPEQALEPREADVRSDIYSLGCTFYHMLTGQAPVPEGTAAKKLYHHQHLAPIDPRQLNPNIPDEIAAILMRMMAKDPKDRYQKPIQLVHHLAQMAQKVGAVSEMPEGLMFLDTALPGAPRFRPMLTIALAALALGFLLMLVALGPSPKVTPPPLTAKTTATVDINKKDKKDVKDVPVVTPITPRPNVPDTVATRDQLYSVVMEANRNAKINVEKDLDFTDGRQVWKLTKPLVLSAKKLVTLKFDYKKNDQDDPNELAAGLVLDGDAPVTFENFRIELNASESFANSVAALAVRGTGQARFRRCIFVSNVPAIDKAKMDMPFSEVLLGNAMDQSAKGFHVNFDECLWESGAQAAVTVQGGGKIVVQNCGFGPHAALFRLRGTNVESELSMFRCSAFVTQGPAFRLDDSHSCKFTIQQSIFSCPESPGEDVQLIRQTEAGDRVTQFDGLRNVYHNLQGLWSSPDEGGGDGRLSLDEFRRRLSQFNPMSKDVDSVVLTSSPWADANPLQKLLNQPRKAFQVTSKLREVRTPEGNALGIVKCVWGPMSPLAPLPSEVKTPVAVQIKSNEKVIDPDAADGTPGIYNSLNKALLSAESGDVLLIKHGKKSREVTLNVLTLPEPKDLVLKPYPGYHPVLVLSTQEKGAAMFRLFDGKLQFDSLEFVLEPDSQDVKGQTVLAMSSNGTCSFKNCVITLKQGEQRRLPLSAVSLLDLDDVMKMPSSPAAPVRSQPIVSFTDSLIRGEGDLVSVKSSRPFELKIDNTLAALAGSLLVIQGANKDLSGEMVMPGLVKMSRVTAFLTEPCIQLRAGMKASGLAPTRCESIRESLFVALGDKPFLALEGVEVGEDMLRQYLDWKGGEKNAYVNMARMLEIVRPDDTMSLGNLDADGWRKLEPDARFFDKTIRFEKLPFRTLQLRPFSQMTFDFFRPTQSSREKLAGFGAQLDPDILPHFSVPRKIETP